MRFIEFLLEAEPVDTDPEDLSSEELQARAKKLQKLAKMKAGGKEDRADIEAMKQLKAQISAAKNPKQKADLQRRFSELKKKGMTDDNQDVSL